MADLFLVYVNKVGELHNGKLLYEFIFNDTITGIDGPEWDAVPSSGLALPPYNTFIKKVGKLETDLILDVLQDSDTYSLWDGVDGIISLAVENIKDYETYPDHRLHFRFGEPIKVVEDKLYEKDLILEYNKKTNEKIKQ